MNNTTLLLDPTDNVGVALSDLQPGQKVVLNDIELEIQDFVSAKHKFAMRDFKPGEDILMYGTIVGEATQAISKGYPITLANIHHKTREYTLNPGKFSWTPPNISDWEKKTFMGYKRSDNQVGTANYWLVLPLVFCENTNVKLLQEAFENALGFSSPNPYEIQIKNLISGLQYEKITETVPQKSGFSPRRIFQNLDGIRFLTHDMGCGGTRQDAESLCALLAGYINHPNVAGATVLSLGCQNAQASILMEKLSLIQKGEPKTVILCDQQQEGTTEQLIQKAITETFKGLIEANKIARQPFPLNKLVIGLECGGSDGFSGISANPTLGRVSDLIVALGGAAILSEFPELCGAEQNLINRCKTEGLANKFVHLMETYNAAAKRVGSGFDMNPSPGNIKDGLLTDAIKSCGAAKKGGTAPVSDILDYTEYLKTPGLNLLCTPGNDVESTTGLAGSGANIILFTTGLGTPTGNPICPVIKVATNHKLTNRMPDIIDFNSGTVITGEDSIESCGDKLLNLIIQVASGEIKTKAEQNRNYDFIPWKRGVSL
ncbi:UxaA family hydrolase [Algoriphagus sp.]|jgi:altronate hydrolase|uniref:UxaA family hydrolase n=1 Tax=Algoriphagus sp. TaxID=1872435 RepID=UPI0027247169|nr:altronate dehydratase family protein [Algoriphagus sp.]MDO8968070.1 altronate dehydratase family protein [Algoriphagus sp.]MDP3202171.1 altronate dehydratase family protein [Algoriphagus sp.]